MDLRLPALRREVMEPRRPASSFGLFAVSTLAMVFAVSSSLLLFSAHRHRVHQERMFLHSRDLRIGPPARAVRPEVPPGVRGRRPVAVTPATVPPAECRGPIYRPTPDGGTEVVFEQCAPRPFARR